MGSDEATQERRAAALNGLGWLEAWRGSFTNSRPLLASAARRLEEASKLRP